MKKFLLVILALIFSLGVFSSCAKKEYDSVNLPYEEKLDVKVASFFHTVKIPDGNSLPLDIATDFQADSFLGDVYYFYPFLIETLGVLKYPETGQMNYSDCGAFWQYALHPEKVFGYSTKVENTFCFTSGKGAIMMIYYKTDKGDFVLLKGYNTSSPEYSEKTIYLFSAEELKPLISRYNETVEEKGLFMGGPLQLNSVTDISQYEITPRLLSWNGIIMIVTALVCIAIAVALIVVKRKKKKS